jgi:hypothetical protein
MPLPFVPVVTNDVVVDVVPADVLDEQELIEKKIE